MTDQSPPETDKAAPPKKAVSPARHAVGVVVLIAVVVVGGFQFSALAAFRSAVGRLNDRIAAEDKELLTQSEAESLIGKQAEDGGSETQENGRILVRKVYTWKGLLKNYALAVYYSKPPDSHLYRIEPEGQKLELEPVVLPTPPPGAKSKKPSAGKSEKKPAASKKKKDGAKGDEKGHDASKADEKSKTEVPKAGADDKKAPEPSKTDEKPKAGADDKKASTPPKADDKTPGVDDKSDTPTKPN